MEGVPLEDSTAGVELIQHTFTKRLLHDSSGEDLPGVGYEVTVRGVRVPREGGSGRRKNAEPLHTVCVSDGVQGAGESQAGPQGWSCSRARGGHRRTH